MENQTKSFLPYLLSEKVTTGIPNKIRFYQFFKMMVGCVKNNSIGNLTLKIESPTWRKDKSTFFLNFYDEKHFYSLLSIEMRETKNQIYFETLPFLINLKKK